MWILFYHGAKAVLGQGLPSHYRGFIITLRHTTVGMTPQDELSTRCRDPCLTNNTHKRQTSELRAGFEPTIPASERQRPYALDRAATGTSVQCQYSSQILNRELTWSWTCTYPLCASGDLICDGNWNTAVSRNSSVVFQCVWKCYKIFLGCRYY
jgi:hypothetical protein